jgi:hypothetical protein
LEGADIAVFGGVQCTAGVEAGSPSFLCEKRQGARYQAQTYADSINVWRIGNPDDPVFSTSPPSQALLQVTFKRALCGACKTWRLRFGRIRVSRLDDHFALGCARNQEWPERRLGCFPPLQSGHTLDCFDLGIAIRRLRRHARPHPERVPNHLLAMVVPWTVQNGH